MLTSTLRTVYSRLPLLRASLTGLQVVLDMVHCDLARRQLAVDRCGGEVLDQGVLIQDVSRDPFADVVKIWGEAYGNEDFVLIQDASQSRWNNENTQRVLNVTVSSPSTQTGFSPFPAQAHPYYYLDIYAAIALSGGLFSILAAVAQYTGALRASRSLFELLLGRVVHATMRWYDVTPQGRILNRFSKVRFSSHNVPAVIHILIS